MGYKVSLGAIESPFDIRDYKIKAPQTANYPKEFILDNLPDVLNQGSVGSCVAHAIAAVMAWHLFRQTGTKKKMSIIGIYGNRRNTLYKNDGMITRDAILGVKEYGNPLYDLLPGNVNAIEAIKIFEENYGSVEKDALEHAFTGAARASNIDEIKHSLTNYGPVIFVVNWFDDMKVKNDILDSEKRETSCGSHCMFIYGWTIRNDKEYWLIQNSWGRDWGCKGRALMPFDMPLSESWEVIDDHIDGLDDVIIPYRSKIGQIFAKSINYIINLIRRIFKCS